MDIWVLILIAYRGGISTQEFSSIAACEHARAAVEKAISWSPTTIYSVCVPKGEPKEKKAPMRKPLKES